MKYLKYARKANWMIISDLMFKWERKSKKKHKKMYNLEEKLEWKSNKHQQ